MTQVHELLTFVDHCQDCWCDHVFKMFYLICEYFKWECLSCPVDVGCPGDVMVVVVRNGYGGLGSNPGWGWLHFTWH